MADVTLEITIPEEYTEYVLEAITALAGTNMSIEIHNTSTNLNGSWNFTIAPQGSETAKQFGERFLRKLGIAAIKLYDYVEDNERYRGEVSNITPPTQDVPDNILE